MFGFIKHVIEMKAQHSDLELLQWKSLGKEQTQRESIIDSLTLNLQDADFTTQTYDL
jgi:hypothetical protein